MFCFCRHVWGVGGGALDEDFGEAPVCSRDGGGHQNTIWEGLIVTGHLYVRGYIWGRGGFDRIEQKIMHSIHNQSLNKTARVVLQS